jgi:hypothetical protein
LKPLVKPHDRVLEPDRTATPARRTGAGNTKATSSHDALHDATDLIEALSQHANAAVCTNTLDGDLAAWATLAAAKASSTAPSPTAPSPT